MKFITVAFIFISFISCRDLSVEKQRQHKELDIVDQNEENFDFYPTSTTSFIYVRDAFAFSYDEEHEQSEWIAYYLDASDLVTTNYDRPFFIEDPLVETASADWRNYKKSGYDKGHLCPAGDRKSSYKSYKETFFTSNISPQKHDFNSGIWNRLEEKTRYWALKYNGLYVITGGVLTGNLKKIGKEKVSVPNYFYKILLTKDGTKMIAFLVPHESSNLPLYEFVTSVDEVEKVTGIDFFPKLEDSSEGQLEAKSDYKNWSFN